MSKRNTPNLSAHRQTVNLGDDELDREAAAEDKPARVRAQFGQGLACPVLVEYARWNRGTKELER